jgi:hypothetical protein
MERMNALTTGRMFRALLLGALLALGQSGLAHAESPSVPPAPTDLRSPTGTEMLSVEPSLIGVDVKPGVTSVTELTLHAAVAQDIKVTVDGLGQQTDGSFQSLPADKDTSPYSARPMITVEPQAFKMQPGDTQKVTVTIIVPPDAGKGTRYAIVGISGLPSSGEQNVGFGVALGVSALVNIAGTQPDRAGVISALTVGEALPGEPLPVTASLQNTGDTHYGKTPYDLIETATLQDASGDMVGTGKVTLTGNSIVPTFTRDTQLKLELTKPLSNGRYHLEVGAGLADGTVLDRKAMDFDWSGGAVLSQTAAPAVLKAAPAALPATASDSAGPPVIAIAALGALVGAVIVGLLVLVPLRRRRPTTAGTAGK